MKYHNFYMSVMMLVAVHVFGLQLAYAQTIQHNPNPDVQVATIVSVQPVYQTVRVNHPVTHCRNHTVEVGQNCTRAGNGYNSHTKTIVGGLLGAAIGNEIAKKNPKHKDAIRWGSAILGGSIGRDLNNNGQRHCRPIYETHKVCDTVDNYRDEQEIIGYDVNYEYNGEVFNTFTTDQFTVGQKVPVRVNVSLN